MFLIRLVVLALGVITVAVDMKLHNLLVGHFALTLVIGFASQSIWFGSYKPQKQKLVDRLDQYLPDQLSESEKNLFRKRVEMIQELAGSGSRASEVIDKYADYFPELQNADNEVRTRLLAVARKSIMPTWAKAASSILAAAIIGGMLSQGHSLSATAIVGYAGLLLGASLYYVVPKNPLMTELKPD